MSVVAERIELMAPTDGDRAPAFARWHAGRDGARIDEVALADATRLSRVFITDDGPAFDSVAFGDLVDFIVKLPF
jgi:hypothetical protein